MAITLDQSSGTESRDSSAEAGRTQRSSGDSTSSAAPPPVEPPGRSSRPAQPARSWVDRYQQHLWIGGVSLLLIAAFSAPIMLAPKPTPVSPVSPDQPTGAATASLPISVSITASEFKFSPNSIQVPVGQKVTLTLQNSGVVEHDVTIDGTGFSLPARAGQTATGEFTFDKPGIFDFICSIPGHKDAGMTGTLTVVDPRAAVAPAPQAANAAAHDRSRRPRPARHFSVD